MLRDTCNIIPNTKSFPGKSSMNFSLLLNNRQIHSCNALVKVTRRTELYYLQKKLRYSIIISDWFYQFEF